MDKQAGCTSEVATTSAGTRPEPLLHPAKRFLLFACQLTAKRAGAACLVLKPKGGSGAPLRAAHCPFRK
jgi:hypothetical protein